LRFTQFNLHSQKILSLLALSTIFAFGGGKEIVNAISPVEDIITDKAPVYIGFGLGVREIEEFDYFYGSLLAGYEFSDFFGLEGRFNMGNDYKTIGGYFKAQYPMELFTPYALAGYAYSDYNYADLTHNFSGFSWGGGVDVPTTYKNFKVFGDVMTYEGADDIYDTEHVLTVGFKYYFD